MRGAGSLGALGDHLRAAGLTPRALAAWAGVERIAALPLRLTGLAAREPLPATAALTVFVAGAEVAIDRLRLPLDELVTAGLLERTGDRVRAPLAVIPLGGSLIVCDHEDARDAVTLVCWPDDSSHHLARALPAGRRPRWIDLGCGSAFAPLARPELAAEILGVDLNPRAVAQARLGAALSRIEHLVIEQADIGVARPRAALVTCNAPIPDEYDAAIWRRADHGFFERLWPAARASLAPGGEVIVHATLAAIPDDLPGEAAIVVYTPPGPRAFAVLWWRPDAPPRRAVGRRELTPARPHLDPADREDVLHGALAPLDH